MRRLQHELAPGDRFPSEHELCREFGVSRETVREALRGLEGEGLISRRRGERTIVLRRPEGKFEDRLTGLVEDFTELKRDTSASVLVQRPVPAPPDVAAALALDDELVYLIQRLRVLDGEPFARHDAYLPIEIGVRLARLDLSRTTITQELRQTLGMDIREDYQQIDAIVADPGTAKLLSVSVGAPLLLVRRLYVGSHGAPVSFFQSCFRSDRYYYTVKFPDSDRRPGQKADPARPPSRLRPSTRKPAARRPAARGPATRP